MIKVDLKYIVLSSSIFFLPNYTQAEIYKCKNSDGVINFTSIPCGQKSSGIKRPKKKTVQLNEDGTKKTKKEVIAERLKKEKEFLEATKRQRIDEKKKKDKLEKHNSKIKQNCNRARKDLERFQRSRYLYKKDANGQRLIASDEQRKKVEIDAQRRVTYWCRK